MKIAIFLLCAALHAQFDLGDPFDFWDSIYDMW